MKNYFILLIVLFAGLNRIAGQTAYQFTGEDCNGNTVDLYSDLDAGKAVILFYYMPDCGACPPPAQQIQEMAYNVLNDFPDMVKGYTFPFLDTYDCSMVTSWVDDSHVPFFTPMDSGEYQVAYYGGFGMPTVVLVGGTDHRVMFSTLSYFTSDTTIIRDSIYRLFGVETGLSETLSSLKNIELQPNPADAFTSLQVNLTQPGDLTIQIADLTGKVVYNSNQYYAMGEHAIPLKTGNLSAGTYVVRMQFMDENISKQLIILK